MALFLCNCRYFDRNVPGVVLYQPYDFYQNHWFWLVAMPTERLNFRKKYSKIFFSEVIRGMKLKLSIHVHDISLYINCVFYCRCPCDFVDFPSTYNGKSGNWHLFLCYCKYFDKVLQKCSCSSPLPAIWILSKLLILIGCHANRKAKFSKKNIQKSSSQKS